jgi:hypothetical protein
VDRLSAGRFDRAPDGAKPAAAWWTARASDAVNAGAYLGLAVTFLLAGAGFAVLAPRYPVVVRVVPTGAAWSAGSVVSGGSSGPGHLDGTTLGMWPLLVGCAVCPPVLALLLLLARRREAALGLVAVGGLLAGCRFLQDLALVVCPLAAERAELWIPYGIDPVRAGPGTLLLLAGDLCAVVAGASALAEAARRDGGHGFDVPAGPPRASRPVMPLAVSFAVLAAAGSLAAPLRSTSPYVSARSAFDAPPWVSLGAFALAAGIVLAAGLAGSSPDHRVTSAGLAGVALAVLGIAVPRIVVAVRVPGLDVAPGPVVAVLGAAGLAVSARWVSVRAWSGTPSGAGRAWSRRFLAEAARVLAGLMCLLSGGCAIVAFLLNPLRLVGGLAQPRIPTTGLLLCTGLVVAGVGWLVAMPRYGRMLRPALAVVAMAMPLAASEYIAAVTGVLDLPGVDSGVGSWFAVAAVLTAVTGALAAVISGGFERDDVDLSEHSFSGPTAPVAAGAAVLALPAYLLPLINGTGRGVTGVIQGPLGLSSWALLEAMIVTVGVGLLGPRCRPVPAAVLYTGGCVLLVLRLARIPFGPRPLPATGLAEGAWASVLCLLLLLSAATIAVHAAQPGVRARPGALSSGGPTVAITRRLRS